MTRSFVEAFVRHSGMIPTVEVAGCLASVWQDAAGRWPEVQVSADRFAQLLWERASHEATVEALDALCTSDLFLVAACLEGDGSGLAQLDAAVRVACARRLPRTTHVGPDDLRQLVLERLLVVPTGRTQPRLADYRARGPLSRWLVAVTLRVALNARGPGDDAEPPRDESHVEDDASSRDPEFAFLKARYREDFKQAFTDALASLDERSRAVIKLTVIDRLVAEQIARVYGVHRVSVARWLQDARSTLLERTRERLSERLRLPAGELESLLRLADGDLDVSLPRLLATPPEEP